MLSSLVWVILPRHIAPLKSYLHSLPFFFSFFWETGKRDVPNWEAITALAQPPQVVSLMRCDLVTNLFILCTENPTALVLHHYPRTHRPHKISHTPIQITKTNTYGKKKKIVARYPVQFHIKHMDPL